MWIIALCVCLAALATGKAVLQFLSRLNALKEWATVINESQQLRSQFIYALQSVYTSLLEQLQSDTFFSPPERKDKAEVPPPPAPTPTAEPKIQKCYRLSTIPADWTPQVVLDALTLELGEEIMSSQPQLSLYPSLDGTSQICILKVTNTNGVLNKLVPKNATTQRIHLNTVKIILDTDFLGLTPLNSPTGKPVADIIAVTGLAGHAFGSWRSRETCHMWLQDHLASNLEGSVRILTFGYDSSLLADREEEPDIMEYCNELIRQLHLARSSDPDRPLIFMGHSLGCIVICRTMLICLRNPAHTALFNATRSFFFFGAPHQGIRTEEMEAMLTDVQGPHAKTHILLRQLREYSGFLKQQSEALGPVWEGRSVFSFYESYLSPTVKKSEKGTWSRDGEMVHLVRRTSSGLMIPEEVRIPVDANHSDIVKFAGSSDTTYMKVIFHLQDLIDNTMSS
ncbi:hypothetical protein EX30DRAFT_212551 [Ascodesmis nigricans]|uniref:DUF676 domain-containing protein n=1 Tax=Ascodesmis nigricans TaxID=341454 RepID=A0A4S2MJT8_9PEZI|nr:hypothetical protein EX30DRAFT_212551 [Ascodesmis nigricans]